MHMGEDGRRANITGIKGNYKAIEHCTVAVHVRAVKEALLYTAVVRQLQLLDYTGVVSYDNCSSWTAGVVSHVNCSCYR